jgi:hypothetical protein
MCDENVVKLGLSLFFDVVKLCKLTEPQKCLKLVCPLKVVRWLLLCCIQLMVLDYSLDHDDFSYVFQLDEGTAVCAAQLLFWPNLNLTCSRQSSPRTLYQERRPSHLSLLELFACFCCYSTV